ncbi:MAG TPA: hypothetical protein VJZ71_08345 [Phycisphaerae bacterium]|nr:hypothetical protein [Phycisphaerae bacterium]
MLEERYVKIRVLNVLTVLAAASIFGASPVQATLVPFTEEFSATSSNWRETGGVNPLAWNAAGGPDGSSYASGPFNFLSSAPNATPAILRAHDAYNSSGDAFVGDWITEGVDQFSVSVRHNAPTALTFFTRFAGSANFPGVAAVNFVPVAPNTWTSLTFAIMPGNPQFVFEGPGATFNTVFSSVGNVQIGVSVPASLAGTNQSYTFDVDKASITPEPASLLLLAPALLLFKRRRS